MDQKKWYQMPVEEVYSVLQTGPEGLNPQEANARREKYGYNELEVKKRGPLVRFLMQFKNGLLYVLIAAAVLTAVLGKFLDMYVIIGVVLATVVIGFIQEGKAESSLESLKKMLVPKCSVRRNNERMSILTREIVPGDIVLLEAGDRVPADMRLVKARDLYADEAALTGESLPIAKDIQPLSRPDLTPGEQRCLCFSGTFITRGLGEGIAVSTGKETEMGKIAGMMESTKRADPPIVKRISEFTRFIIIACLAFGAISFILGIALGYDLGYMLLAAAGMIVAMIPEGLAAAIIAAFAVGSIYMARRNALIRRLPAAETLGCTTVICSDKTGTLTRNEMTVTRIYCGREDFHLTGSGYEPVGEIIWNDEVYRVEDRKELAATLTAGLCCNNALLEKTDDERRRYAIKGDPTEGALVVSAAKAGINLRKNRLDEIPFDSTLMYMATLHQDGDNNVIFVKGSPEVVLRMCSTELVGDQIIPLDIERAMEKVNEMAGEALRVLAMAYIETGKDKARLEAQDVNGLTFLGLQGMIDPPRPEAIEAIRKCKAAGIRPVMITGDHALTAKAIASQMGIGEGETRTLSGQELSQMTDEELAGMVDQVSVYARVAPEHKFRITKQLQSQGHVVAMTGDGVNDAPALKAADIGVAMGITGTEVSKEAADIVLADDNFASIVSAVEEGRHVFSNIWKVILYLLPTNGGQGLVMVGAVLLSPFIPIFAQQLPIEPVQILWVNLIMAIACSIPLIWEPKEKGILDKPPRNAGEKLVNPLFIRRVGIVSLISAAAAFSIFLWYTGTLGDSETAIIQGQTAAFTTLIMVQLFYLFTARSVTESAFTFSPFSNRILLLGAGATVVLQLLIIYAEPLFGMSPFRTLPFPAWWWLPIIGVSLAGFLIIELEKLLARNYKGKK